MKCNNCGHENDKDIIFCKKCGERLEKPKNADETKNDNTKGVANVSANANTVPTNNTANTTNNTPNTTGSATNYAGDTPDGAGAATNSAGNTPYASGSATNSANGTANGAGECANSANGTANGAGECANSANGAANAADNSSSKSTANSTTYSSANCTNNQVNNIVDPSPLKRSWTDIIHSPKWFGKGLLLGLINCVPILNFTTAGYAQKWGSEADINTASSMPSGYITNKTFLTGFFEFITWVVWMIVWGIASWAIDGTLGAIPFIGFLILLAVWVAKFFWESITSLASMKCALTSELGQAFNVKEIFTKWTKGWGRLFTSYFIPKLLCSLIGIGVFLILMAICAASFTPNVISLITTLPSILNSSNFYSIIYQILPILGQLINTLSIIILFGWIVFSILGAFEKLIRYRAVGYWIECYAKEWK